MTDDFNLSSPSVIISLLKRYDLRPQKKFGQNFLADSNILRHIVESGNLAPGSQVFEIGAGLGVLTRALSDAVGEKGRVIAVECDHKLIPVLGETLDGRAQTSLIEADVMSLNLAELFDSRFDSSQKISVVANIPYQITSPLIAAIIEQKKRISQMVFLVQKEVALRLAAASGSTDYGSFSVFCQYHCIVENLFTAPRTVFYPPPEVTSAVIRLTPRDEAPAYVENEDCFFKVVRAAFGQRRKTLSNALSGSAELGWSKEQVASALRTAKIDPSRRGETLTIAQFAGIANAAPATISRNDI